MHIKGLLFDFDGTLANTLPVCIKTFQHTFQEYTGRSFTEQEIISHFGISEEGILQRVIGDQWQPALDRFMEIYTQLHVECAKPFAQVETVLQHLKDRGIALGLVTGKGPRSAEFSLNYLNLAHYFDNIEVGNEHAIVKAQAMKKILAEWHMDPSEAAYIGDTDTDMMEARIAGVLPIGACWADTTTIDSTNMAEPLITFTSIDSFIDWLDEHTERQYA
jgi:pyrophosphatase PpaX